mgnify:CR=1 FL=1
MNALRNKVQLIGNLGNAPQVITTENGKKLAKFSVATNETYTGRTGRKEKETTWHNIVAWGNVAEIAEKFVEKGWDEEKQMYYYLVYFNKEQKS